MSDYQYSNCISGKLVISGNHISGNFALTFTYLLYSYLGVTSLLI